MLTPPLQGCHQLSPRCAVVLPGGLHGPYTPLLKYAADAAGDRAASIHPVWWRQYERPLTLAEHERSDWVSDHLAPELAAVAGSSVLLIGRSLASYGAGVAATHSIPAIWFNPVLNSATVVRALERTQAPVMLIGGTADPMWNPKIARRVADQVVEIPDADHSLRVPGALANTAAALATSITAVEDFMDATVWPHDAPDVAATRRATPMKAAHAPSSGPVSWCAFGDT